MTRFVNVRTIARKEKKMKEGGGETRRREKRKNERQRKREREREREERETNVVADEKKKRIFSLQSGEPTWTRRVFLFVNETLLRVR